MRIPLKLSLAKTASFAVVHFMVAFGVAYLITGSAPMAGALALLEPLANTVAFFFHDRAWARFGHVGHGHSHGHIHGPLRANAGLAPVRITEPVTR